MAPLDRRDGSHIANGRVYKEERWGRHYAVLPVHPRGQQEGASQRMVLGEGRSCTLLLLLFRQEVVSSSLRPHRLQHSSFPCLSQSPGVSSHSCPSCWWCHPTILSSLAPFSFCPQSLTAPDLFQWDDFPHQVAKVLELQLQHQSFQRILRVDFLQDYTSLDLSYSFFVIVIPPVLLFMMYM